MSGKRPLLALLRSEELQAQIQRESSAAFPIKIGQQKSIRSAFEVWGEISRGRVDRTDWCPKTQLAIERKKMCRRSWIDYRQTM